MKPSSHPNQDMLVSMETDPDLEMDTEEVFESNFVPATTVIAEGDAPSRTSAVVSKEGKKHRTKAASLKVFDFDFEDSDGSVGSEGKGSPVSNRATVRANVAASGRNTRKYNTVRNLGKRKVNLIGGGRLDKLNKKGELEVKGGGGKVAMVMGGKGVAEDSKDKLQKRRMKVVGDTELGDKMGAGVNRKGVGGRPGNGNHGNNHCKSGDSDLKEKPLLTDLIGSVQPNLPDSKAELLKLDPRHSNSIPDPGFGNTGSNTISEDIFITSCDSNMHTRTTNPAEFISESNLESSSKKRLSKANRVELKSTTGVQERKTVSIRKSLKDKWLEGSTASGDITNTTSQAELPGLVKPSSAATAGKSGKSSVTQAEKTVTERKKASRRGKSTTLTSNSPSIAQLPAIGHQVTEGCSQEGSIEVNDDADSRGRNDDALLNGAWSSMGVNPRVGKRKRVWLVETEEKEPTDSVDPYAFDFAEESNSPIRTVPQAASSQLRDAPRSNTQESVEGTRRADYSQTRPVAVRKGSEDIDCDMLQEIDTMLDGYEEHKEEDVGSRLSPDVSLTEPRVGKLKKCTSEGGRGKARRYAYTTRQGPGPSNGGEGGVPRLKKSLTWPRRPRRGPEIIKVSGRLIVNLYLVQLTWGHSNYPVTIMRHLLYYWR